MIRKVLVAFVVSSLALGQQLSVTVSPNPAPLGTPITVTAQAVTSGLYTPFGCLITSVRSTMPNGPTVGVFPCTFLPGAIPPCTGTSVRTGTWTPSGSIQAGTYWFEIQHQPQMFGGPATSEWFSVTLEAAPNTTPVLTATNMPTFGTAFIMNLSAPAEPTAFYGVALSATTNTGIPIPGGHVSLDADFLFDLSLTQDPNFFANFTGALDLAGTSPVISLFIPPIGGIPCVPLHAQAVVFTSGGGLALSNCLNFTIK